MEVKATLNDLKHEMVSRGLLEKEKHYWLNYKGEKVYIEDIDDKYLTNIYNMVMRIAKKRQEEEERRRLEEEARWIYDEVGECDPNGLL